MGTRIGFGDPERREYRHNHTDTPQIKLFFVDQNGLLSVIGYDPGNTNGW